MRGAHRPDAKGKAGTICLKLSHVSKSHSGIDRTDVPSFISHNFLFHKCWMKLENWPSLAVPR